MAETCFGWRWIKIMTTLTARYGPQMGGLVSYIVSETAIAIVSLINLPCRYMLKAQWTLHVLQLF